jgi:anti-sigma factor RsiW
MWRRCVIEYPAAAASPTCIESDVLAAYIDGRLDASGRRGVERHLADCDRCDELVTEVGRMQEAEAPRARWQRRLSPFRGVTAAVVALAAAGIVLASC